MSKHTPGPWSACEDIGAVFGRDGLPIATGGRESYEEYQANARLIAAAPEMLEMLKQLSYYFRTQPYGQNGPLEDVLNMIAKAEGK